ncbi:hypothetical protein OS493_006867 [Desmophyllum pertusum]|uniref:Uncharacterized protein n=1 Tax=Desmophyllum pertusum TaxID=174260 RepID=A0A9W9ZSE0_9CNID|nr:hypothetical protein OS493_006867 [Desmophyllum pertusum]
MSMLSGNQPLWRGHWAVWRSTTLHLGFQDVCLNRHVLEIAALGLKTKAGKSYQTMFLQGQRTEAEFMSQWHTGNLLDCSGSLLVAQDAIQQDNEAFPG